jgi:hypothetical protein
MSVGHIRSIARQLLPGVALPGLIYLLVSQHVSVLMALAAASSVPLLDAGYRAVTGRSQSPVGLIFLVMTGGSVALALWLRSPMFILAKGAVVTALIGLTFVISALVRRPLTRTLAVSLSTECPRGRASLRRAWAHPGAMSVFCTLSTGWGILLLVSAAQQAVLALTVSPGLVMTLEPPVQLAATLIGVGLSVAYVRRRQRVSPDVRLLPIPVTIE